MICSATAERRKCYRLEVWQETDKADAERRQAERIMSSGQLIKSAARSSNVDEEDSYRTSKSSRKHRNKKRRAGRRNKSNNVNASTQTTIHDDDDRRGTRTQLQDLALNYLFSPILL